MVTRRQVLRAAVGAVVVAGCAPEARVTSTVGSLDFDRRLDIPPLAESRVDGGRRVFELTARAGRREFRPGRVATTWGVNGDYLGPTVRARRGERVLMNVHNELDEPTTIHWHGMHLPAVADGGPHQPIEPGSTWSPSWRINQPAATLWYHPHPHGRTERHTYRGLAGLFIVDDEQEAALDLPRTYGVDDIPVIVQDKRFDDDGSFVDGVPGPAGRLGDTLLVNGTLSPHLPVTTRRIRLRLLNASTARTYSFGLSDGRDFALVGTDGGLLGAPSEVDHVQLSPGERAEIVVLVGPGERVVLRSTPPSLGTPGEVTRRAGGEDSFDVLQLRAAAVLDGPATVPNRLVDVPRLAPGTATRSFRLLGRSINGAKMSMDRIDEVVTVDTTEVWEVVNRAEQPHNFHVHGVQFQVTGTPAWKDTVYLPPKQPVRLVLRFTEYTDPAVPYMYHCHLSMHEDQGMMGQFVVVEPGQHAEGHG
jgi:FtsP/CotA-like multicopper oxidase with cupredoxin domain